MPISRLRGVDTTALARSSLHIVRIVSSYCSVASRSFSTGASGSRAVSSIGFGRVCVSHAGIEARPCAVRRLRAGLGFHSSSIAKGRPPPALLPLAQLATDEHHSLARSWVDGFKEDDIPRDALDIGFSRSSGPGGQHVNKTNSKATVRCDLGGSWLPPFVIESLRSSAHYLSSPPSLLIASQTSRSAPQNQAAALAILHQTIVSAARSVIKGQTSSAQKTAVQGLIRREEGRRREDKARLKSKKAARRE